MSCPSTIDLLDIGQPTLHAQIHVCPHRCPAFLKCTTFVFVFPQQVPKEHSEASELSIWSDGICGKQDPAPQSTGPVRAIDNIPVTVTPGHPQIFFVQNLY